MSSSLSLSQESSATTSKRTTAANGRRRPRRRSAPPPARLSWPGALTSTSTSSSQQQPESCSQSSIGANAKNKNLFKKRPRSTTEVRSTGDEESSSSLLWTDRYAPTSRQELCVAPKKVSEVAMWMEQEYLQLKLLILVGNPGIGKSTMVRLLAQELSMDVLEWNDSYSSSFALGDGSGDMESLSPLKSFAKFLQQCGVGFSALEIGSSKSKNTNNNQSNNLRRRRRLVILEELPNLANAEMQDQFRRLFTEHIQNTHVPTVWIYSDGSEGHSKPQDLERHIDAPVLYQNAKILQINPVTKAQLKKTLERIAKAEHFKLSKEMCEQWHVQSGGDVRFAIMALQFDRAGQTTKKVKQPLLAKKKPKTASTLDSTNNLPLRDTHWSAFHALGKVLYAKRIPVEDLETELREGERPPLAYDPEEVLEHCDFDLGHALTYLGFHSADFYTDIEELSEAMDLYSDSSFLLEQSTNYNYKRKNAKFTQNTTISCPIFPEGYVTSLAGRAVAHTNLHPAPSRFRSLDAPKVLEVGRKARDNARELQRLQQRLSLLTISNTANNLNHLSTFVTDWVPFMRKIVPEAVNASLDNLHTINSEDNGGSHFGDWQQQQEAEAVARLEEEQREVLRVDDIDEYSSSDENEGDDEFNATKQNGPFRKDKNDSSTMMNSALSEVGRGNMSRNTTTAATPRSGISSNTVAPKAQFKPMTVINNPYRSKKPKNERIPPPRSSSVGQRVQPKNGTHNQTRPNVATLPASKAEPKPNADIKSKSESTEEIILVDV